MKIIMLLGLLVITTSLPAYAQEKGTNDEANEAVTTTSTSSKPQPSVDITAFIADNASLPAGKTGKKENLRLTLKFLVDEQGDLTDVTVIKSSGNPELDDEAIRVVESMPSWKPGMSKGRLVKMYYTLPLKFVLEPEGSDLQEGRQGRMNQKKEKRDEDKEEREERTRERKESKEKEEE